MKHTSCKPRSEFFITHRSVRPPGPLLAWALCLTAVVSAPASAQLMCENAYKYFSDASHWKKGVDNVVEPTVIREKRRQLNACVAATSNDVNKGKALYRLGHLSLAEDNFQEAIQLYRRTLSAANWTTDTEIRFRDQLADAIWESKNYQSYIHEASYMLSTFHSKLGCRRELLYSRRAQAHEKLGNKNAALSDFLQSGLLDDSQRKSFATKEALRLMRERSWRPSCSVLDNFRPEDEDLLDKVNDCLTSKNLPAYDKAEAYRLQALIYEGKKEPDESFRAAQRLAALQPDPPTYTSTDYFDKQFSSAASNASMAHRMLFHMIRTGDMDGVVSRLKTVERQYGDFLDKVLTKGSPLKSSYGYYVRSDADKREEVATRFFLPVIGWLVGTGDAGWDKARDLLRSRISLATEPKIIARLLMTRGNMNFQKRKFALADQDFERTVPTARQAKDNVLARSAQRSRALIMAEQGKFGEAYNRMTDYFGGVSDHWTDQPTNELVDAHILRADFAARAGMKDEAGKHIETLRRIYKRYGQACEPCTQIEQNMKE